MPLVWGGAADDVLQAIQGPTEAAGAICSAGEGPYRAGAFILLPDGGEPVGPEQEYSAEGVPTQGLAAVQQRPGRNIVDHTEAGADYQSRQSGPRALAVVVAVR